MTRRHGWRTYAVGILALALGSAFLSVGHLLDRNQREALQSEQKVSTLKSAAILSGRIKQVLETNIALVHGMAAIIASNPELTQTDFARLGRELIDRSKIIRNLGGAPDLVLRLMYPVAGNEAAIGLDYTKNAAQKDAALRAKEAKNMVLAGPLNLLQGGRAIIGRMPVFLTLPDGSKHFWGLVSTVMSYEGLLQETGLSQPPRDIRIALRGADSLGPQGAVFYGDPALFEHPDILLDIPLPVGSWQLAVAATTPAGDAFPLSWQYRLIGGLLTVLTAALLWLFSRWLAERERALQEQLESAALMRQATSLGDMGSWRYDIRKQNMVFSPETHRILGFSEQEPAGPNQLLARILDADRERAEQAMAAAVRGDAEYDIEYRVVRKPGTIRWLRSRATLIRDTNGKPESLLGLVQDITNFKTIESGLISARDEAESANRSKSEFLANMSHELRTPLNAIIGLSEMMRMGIYGDLKSAKYREYVHDIQASGQHLLELINQVLDLSRIEARRTELQEEVLDLRQQAEAALHLIGRRMEDQHKTWELLIAEDFPLLRADPGGLRSMLLNLLSNAIKFTGERGHITVGARAWDNGSLSLWVADNGIGIPPEHVDQVTQPFQQVERAWVRSHEGTGLGLAITKSMIELHGGWLHIDSREDEGTQVTLHFPPERQVLRG
ncbi:hypothetical protein JCM17960_04800 [Magnetospira thiophila]